MAEIRKRFGPFEYVAFVELTTGRRTPGHRPHLHLLVRCPTTPPAWLSRRWWFHNHGSFRVDRQAVRSPLYAAGYLAGYTVGQRKKEQQIHLTSWPGPRVRYSRGYSPERVAVIRDRLLSAWRQTAGHEPPEGSWEWLGPAEQAGWQRWQMAIRLAREQSFTPSAESHSLVILERRLRISVAVPPGPFSLHDNSVAEMIFVPELAQLRVVMDDPIVGTEGKRTLAFSGVRALSISGSTKAGHPGFIPGDEVLSLVVEQESHPDQELWRIRFLVAPVPNMDRLDTGLNVLEIVAEGFEFEH